VTPVYASRATDLLNVRAAITLIDLDRPAVASVEALRKAFDLTPKEGEVAAGLAQGLDIIAIAELNGTSSATVRQQVKRLFTKTNTHRQAELTLLLSRVVMSWR
jgi:DNA-binding NarL/FixJ family response regulator